MPSDGGESNRQFAQEINIPLTQKQIQLARRIDEHVGHVIANGGDDEDLLRSLYDYMDAFKQLMDMSTTEEMNTLCQRYDGFYRFAKLLEALADGSISVPQ